MKKNYIIYIFIILIVIVIFLMFMPGSSDTAILVLKGDDYALYQGEDYHEPGYEIKNNQSDINSYHVDVSNNINNQIIGTYKVSYKLYSSSNDLLDTKERKVFVIANDKNIVFELNGEEIEYYFIGTYLDKGFVAKNNNVDISNNVRVDNKVNNDVIGTYNVTYTLFFNGKERKLERIINIVDFDIKVVNDSKNKSVSLEINNRDYDYVLMPNNEKNNSKDISYKYGDNKKVTFDIYLKSGSHKVYEVDISSFDNDKPKGSCTATLESNNLLNVNISASDSSGIKKYQYNNKDYTTNKFSINDTNNPIVILVYDNNDNYAEITCKKKMGSSIKSINTTKSTYIKCNSSLDNDNKTLDDNIKSFGYKTRDSVVYSALYLANYDKRIAYQWGGKYQHKGLNPNWGCKKEVSLHDGRLICARELSSSTCEAGLDCTGFTAWAFVQAGFSPDIIRTSSQSTGMWGNFNAKSHKYAFNKNNLDYINKIQIGDLVWREGHVAMVIGIGNDSLQIVNAKLNIDVQKISKYTGKSIDGPSNNFTHFVLFEDFYKMYGASG